MKKLKEILRQELIARGYPDPAKDFVAAVQYLIEKRRVISENYTRIQPPR